MGGGPRREFLRDHGGAALAILSALAFRFHRLIFEGISVLNDEMADEYLPLSANVFGQIRRGELPLWSPEILFGYPAALTPDLHLFSPFSWAHVLFEPQVALGLQMMSIQLVAAFGIYALARTLDMSAWAAAVAAVLWVSGCVAENTMFVSMCLATIPWIPLVLLLWHRYASRGDLRRAAVAGGALGLALLGGQAQFVYWTLIVLVAYLVFVVRPLGTWRKDGWSAISGAAVTAAVAVAIAAVTVLPTVQLVRDSIRASLEPEERILNPQLSLAQTWSALRWTVFCAKEREGVEGDAAYRSVGMLAVGLALLAFGRGRRFDNRLLMLGLVLLVLSLASYFPPSHWIVKWLPFNQFRYPARIGLFSSIVILLLAGRGVDRLLAGGVGRGRGLLALGTLAALCAPGIAELLRSGDWLQISEGKRDIAALILPALALALPFPARPWPLLRRLLILLAAAWCVVHSQLATNEPGWITARAWGPSAGIWARRGDKAPTTRYPPAHLQWVPRHNAYGPTRILRLDSRYEHDVPLLTGHHSPLGLVSLRPGRVDRLVYNRQRASDLEAPLEATLARQQPLLDLFNIQYLVVSAHRFREHFDDLQRARSMVVAGSLGPFALVENSTHLPRAFFVNTARAARDGEESRALVTSEGFAPRRVVVLETDEPVAGAWAPRFQPATVTHYENERVEIDVSAPMAGWLVLLDRWAPGWTATYDGTPAPILRANYLFRAVHLGAGRHRVVFEYRNAAFLRGLALSALGVGVAIAAAVSLRRSPR